MINSKEVLYSAGSNDECMTLDYAVRPIIKYIPKDWVVWCPFDTENSEFVKQIRANGNKVIRSHISEGKDFYTYEPEEHWDCIVSNPPFTNKRRIFERALSFNKPFALIAPMTWWNDNALFKLFRFKELQLLSFNKRMRFLNNGVIQNKITFASGYFCYNILPKQIIFEELDVK